MDDSTDSDTFPREDSGTTGGSAAEGFRQFGRWLKEHLGMTSDAEDDQ
jgi:hypothetical protein